MFVCVCVYILCNMHFVLIAMVDIDVLINLMEKTDYFMEALQRVRIVRVPVQLDQRARARTLATYFGSLSLYISSIEKNSKVYAILWDIKWILHM